MTDADNKSSFLSSAATDGLKLALITLVVTSICSMQIPQVLNVILWMIQTFCSIWYLSYLMKAWKDKGNDSNFGYGFAVCLFSSIITAVYAFASYQWLFPSLQEQTIEVFEQMAPMMNGTASDALSRMQDNFAQYYCISTLFKNSIIGLIVAAIISGNHKDRNIFKEEEEEL